MRRSFLLLPFLLLVGCAPEANEGKIVLRVSNWGGAGDDSEYDRMVQEFYKEFERENPGVDLRIEGIPGEYVPKMMLNFVAGTEPDVMTVDASSAAIFVNNGVLADLTPIIAKDPSFKLTDYFPNVLDIGRRGDKLYMIPGDFTPMVVYYNKRLFDAAGVPYPKPGWTFDDFLATSKALTKPGQHGFVFSNWMPGWVMWLWNNGGEVLSPDGKRATGYLNGPKNVETISFIRDLINVHKVSPSLSAVAAQGVDPFANGGAAMTVSGHWGMVGYKNAPKDKDGKPKIDWRELGVVEMPTNVGRSHTVMYEGGYGITSRCKNKELAWKFIKMWTGYRLQRQYNASGIAISGRIDVAKERATDPVEKEFLRIVPTARPPAGSRVEGYEVVEKYGLNALDAILKNGKDVSKALTDAAKRIDTEFAKRG
ncbi:MAG: ABC transporter substrate-binding protein [Fimbriimonas sp.]